MCLYGSARAYIGLCVVCLIVLVCIVGVRLDLVGFVVCVDLCP